MLSTLVVAGAFLQATNAEAIDLYEAPPTAEPTWEPTVEPEATEELEVLAEGYVYGTADHDSCPTDYIPITSASECQQAAAIMGVGWYGARGIGVCTYITNSKHVADNNKYFYGPIGATEAVTADHHTLVCKRPECGEIERNYDYVGGDLEDVHFVDSAEACSQICHSTPNCHSFTYVKKASDPNFKTCTLKSELKHTVRTLDDCCDSGLPCDAEAEPECVSLPPGWMDQDNDGCAAYGSGGWCGASWQGMFAAGGYTADEACCECGGGTDAMVVTARRRTEAVPRLRRFADMADLWN